VKTNDGGGEGDTSAKGDMSGELGASDGVAGAALDAAPLSGAEKTMRWPGFMPWASADNATATAETIGNTRAKAGNLKIISITRLIQ